MDVTALLNSSSSSSSSSSVKGETATNKDVREIVDHGTSSVPSTTEAAETTAGHPSSPRTSSQEKAPVHGSRLPCRSRTPWNADGYALPLTLDTKSTRATVHSTSNTTSPAGSGSPRSPRHKFSESYSSLSSSSTLSSHSRISSMSTVGGVQHTQSDRAELTIPKIWSPGTNQKPANEAIISPPSIRTEAPAIGPIRSSSPSDTMLMSRGRMGAKGTDRQDATITKDTKPDLNRLAPFDFTKAHKRAISAPDFNVTEGIDRTFPPLSVALQRPISPPHRVDLRPYNRPDYTTEAMSPPPAFANHLSQDGSAACMYQQDCDTGSSLRKAISHIFGRNKTCTRNIPPKVWVHYCRKHYQRSRYRNGPDWADTQCELVQRQIRRVQEWSDENRRTGQPGVIRDWSLSMRKREKTRIQEKSAKKRSHREDSEDEGDDIPDSAVLNGTAVPEWLRARCGSGYTTAEIEEIVARMRNEIRETQSSQIPDIEILPNISMETSDDTNPKAIMRQRSSPGSQIHKRSQSVGVALRPEPRSMMRRVSQPAYVRHEEDAHLPPDEKRRRISGTPPYGAPHSALASSRPIHSLPHRQGFSNIQESRAEEPYYHHETTRAPEYSHNRWPNLGPQRNQIQPMGAASGISGHQRSFSEAGSVHPSFPYQPPFQPPYHYGPMPAAYFTDPTSYGRGAVPPAQFQPTPAIHNYYDGRPVPNQRGAGLYQPPLPTSGPGHPPLDPSYRHMRHQSTPSVSHTNTPQGPVSGYEYPTGIRPHVPHEQLSPYHHRQHPYAQPHQNPPRPVVQESDRNREDFSERR
ncbi:hypothetical protein F4813DRAFT_4173 [Daldinia decipiens]|uniref:uncharacterized protein n=1 Tax=Daldinia decipiens TaxID=326647 RepID=UPI0020C3D2E6|nr:uncharacterized protein F4813DRAFT_4173 [Daldinia decipiens]KAI1662614.1 hypothetical protein F4813DRAFT_4173 [Daldinia decipiens]